MPQVEYFCARAYGKNQNHEAYDCNREAIHARQVYYAATKTGLPECEKAG